MDGGSHPIVHLLCAAGMDIFAQPEEYKEGAKREDGEANASNEPCLGQVTPLYEDRAHKNQSTKTSNDSPSVVVRKRRKEEEN